MTVSAAASRNDYVGTGLVDTYTYSFRITSASDLRVTTRDTDGLETTLTYPTDYSVTGVGVFSGGTITLTAGVLALDYALTIRDDPTVQQDTDLRNQAGPYQEALEDALDYVTRVVKSQADVLDRALTLSETITGVSAELPAPVAGYALVWNATEDGLQNAMPAGAPTSAFMATVLDDETAQAARNTLGIDGLGSAFRNRIINGAMLVTQRATSATVTAGTAVPTASAGYPCVDRWFVYSTGANVTAARVGSGLATNRLQITGAASVTAVGIGQRIEQANSADLAGQTVTLSVDLANSLLTEVTWTLSYANSADAFGTIGTPTKTQIATGTFTVDANPTRYSAQITLPAGATTGLEILFTVGAQVSGTWQVGNVQIERGATAGTFDPRSYGQELALCHRYLPAFLPAGGTSMVGPGQCVSTTAARVQFAFPVTPRVVPTGISATAAGGFSVVNAGGSVTCTSIVASTLGHRIGRVEFNVAAGLTAGQACEGLASSTSSILFTGCELP